MNERVKELLKTKCALIVVDMQNDYCHPDGACAKIGSDVSRTKTMVPNLKKLIDWAHQKGIQVILIQTIHTPETDSAAWLGRSGGKSGSICRPGTWGIEFFEISPAKGDIIVNKHRYSAFINTRMDSVLHTLKTETLIMTGVSTNVCVESTARDGFMLDYNILFVSDCCSAASQAAHDMALENITKRFGTVVGSDELYECLK